MRTARFKCASNPDIRHRHEQERKDVDKDAHEGGVDCADCRVFLTLVVFPELVAPAGDAPIAPCEGGVLHVDEEGNVDQECYCP